MAIQLRVMSSKITPRRKKKRSSAAISGAALLLAFLIITAGLAACSADPAEQVFNKAEKSLGLGAHLEAISQYSYVLGKYPASRSAPTSQYRIAYIYNKHLNDKKKALEAYSTLLLIYPSSAFVADALSDMATIYSQADDHAKSIEFYQRLLKERREGRDEVQYLIATEYILLNDFKQAHIELMELLKSGASARLTPNVYLQIANVYYIEGRHNEAVEWYGKAADGFPDTDAGHEAGLGVARALNESGRPLESLAALKAMESQAGYKNKGSARALAETIEKRLAEEKRAPDAARGRR
ncbi:MAG: tetratricopeptide repeat protein [Deltaproteobacteria bacterium]|nr:tetratricopeptide repeat protein [Deltaproteobacteria bacterium]